MAKRFLIFAILIITALGGSYYFYLEDSGAKFGYVYIKDRKYLVEIADNDEKRMAGLQNMDKIGKADGMLFVFGKPGFYSFWMKDVRFPLDFIWINNGKIIGIKESVPIPTGNDYPSYSPPEPVTDVIEFEAGRIIKDDIKVGDLAEIAI